MLEIIELPDKVDPPYKLLLSADPSYLLIKEYLAKDRCFIARLNDLSIGALVIIQQSHTELEIKNIAVEEKYQGRSYGKQLLQFATDFSKKSGNKKLTICTGNSSINQLALYQKMEFEIERIDKDFFLKNYSNTIFENGIQCKHLLILSLEPI
ncbi:MAG: GNAT family N-acetyltransferase [Flammeovirgaceae bacterium]|nr:GNAT family N-acetyltransferase [Flammeovirgaceae bacterium]